MSGIYARIEISETSIKTLESLGLNVNVELEGVYQQYGKKGYSIPMEDGSDFLEKLEKLGYPVPIQGVIEDDCKYVFVCPGDGTYAEVQCTEFGNPVVPVFWDGTGKIMKMMPGDTNPAVTYFQALDRFNEEVKKK